MTTNDSEPTDPHTDPPTDPPPSDPEDPGPDGRPLHDSSRPG